MRGTNVCKMLHPQHCEVVATLKTIASYEVYSGRLWFGKDRKLKR